MTPSITQHVERDNLTPQSAAESLRSVIRAAKAPTTKLCFTCNISGPLGSGKTTALARLVEIAFECGISLDEIAVFAPTQFAIRRLRMLAAAPWPDVEPADLFAPVLSGTPDDALRMHTALACDDTEYRLGHVAHCYLDHLARLNGLAQANPSDMAFRNSLKPRVLSGLRADIEARTEQVPLPRNSYLHAIANFVGEYKRSRRLADRADLLHAGYYQSHQVRILLLDEIAESERSLIVRYFPQASVVDTSLTPHPADVVIALPRCLRQPRRLDIVDDDPVPTMVPPLPAFDSLFIVAPPWRHRRWLYWLHENAIPPPPSARWRAIAAAWRFDQEQSVPARALNPLLARAGLEPVTSGRWLVEPGEVDGWSSWLDVGAHDPVTFDHALGVLARYGRLDHLPTVRLGMAPRHVEADVVIADGSCGWRDDDDEQVAVTRATKQLVTLQRP